MGNSIWTWTETIKESAGALVVAAIIATITLGGTAWISIVRMDDDIAFLKDQAKVGGRHTAEMQKTHVEFMNLVIEGIKEDIFSIRAHDIETEKKIDSHLRLSDKKVSEYDLKIQRLEKELEECGG